MGLVFRYLSLLGMILSFHGFLLVQSQQIQPQFQSPPPPQISFDSGNTRPQVNSPPPPPPSQFKVGLIPPISPPPSSTPSLPLPPIPKSPPPPRSKASPPQSNSTGSHSRNQQPRRILPPPPPPLDFKQSEKSGLNTGKTVGFVFAGFAAILQICFAAFLVFKRKQFLKMTHAI